MKRRVQAVFCALFQGIAGLFHRLPIFVKPLLYCSSTMAFSIQKKVVCSFCFSSETITFGEDPQNSNVAFNGLDLLAHDINGGERIWSVAFPACSGIIADDKDPTLEKPRKIWWRNCFVISLVQLGSAISLILFDLHRLWWILDHLKLCDHFEALIDSGPL